MATSARPEAGNAVAAVLASPQFQTLQKRLAQIQYTNWEDHRDVELAQGDPAPYVAFIRHTMTHFRQATQHLLAKYDWYLLEENNVRVISSALRLLQCEYGVKTAITVEQFMRPTQFVMAKIGLVLQVISQWAKLDKRQRDLASAKKQAVKENGLDRPRVPSQLGSPVVDHSQQAQRAREEEGRALREGHALESKLLLLERRHRELNHLVREWECKQ